MVQSKSRLMNAVGTPCPYCGVSMTKPSSKVLTAVTRDHVFPNHIRKRTGLPLAKGVPVTVKVCARCNMDKGGRLLSEWLEILIAANDVRVQHVHSFIQLRQEGLRAAVTSSEGRS